MLNNTILLQTTLSLCPNDFGSIKGHDHLFYRKLGSLIVYNGQILEGKNTSV